MLAAGTVKAGESLYHIIQSDVNRTLAPAQTMSVMSDGVFYMMTLEVELDCARVCRLAFFKRGCGSIASEEGRASNQC